MPAGKKKTEWIYLQGKAKWCSTTKPDKFGKWKVTLYFSQNSSTYETVQGLLKEGLKNHLNQDEDGFYMTFSRPQQKEYNGKVMGFTAPEVIEPDGKPCRHLVGNGSDVTIKCSVYGYRNNPGIACRLESIRVDTLIPYETKRDFTTEQHAAVMGLDEQPAQVQQGW